MRQGQEGSVLAVCACSVVGAAAVAAATAAVMSLSDKTCQRVGPQENQCFSVRCRGSQRVTGLSGYHSDGLDGINAVTCDDGAGSARTEAIGASSLGLPYNHRCGSGYEGFRVRYRRNPVTGADYVSALQPVCSEGAQQWLGDQSGVADREATRQCPPGRRVRSVYGRFDPRGYVNDVDIECEGEGTRPRDNGIRELIAFGDAPSPDRNYSRAAGGIIIGVLVLVAAIAAIAFAVTRRRRGGA